MFLLSKTNWWALAFLYLASVIFLIKITDYWPNDSAKASLSPTSIDQIKNINQKYTATIMSPLFNNDSSLKIQADLLSADLMNLQNINAPADILLKFRGNKNENNIVPVQLADKSLTDNYLQDIKNIPEVVHAEKNIKFTLNNLEKNIKFTLNNDNSKNDQDELAKQAYFNFRHNFDELKDINKTVKIAVFDTGIDVNNGILMSQVWYNENETINEKDDDNNNYIDDIRGWNFVDNNNDINDLNGHGSHITGVLTFNPKVKIIPIKVLNKNGESSLQTLLQAFAYIKDKDVDIINLSLGTNTKSNLLKEVIDNIENEKTVVIVAAAGNQNMTDPYYPAYFDEVMAVCAMDRTNKKRYKNSNYGNWVDYCYRGEDLYNFDINNSFSYKSGTSQSSAHLSFFISIYMLFNDDYSLIGIRDFLDTLANKFVFSREQIGQVIDFEKLLTYLQNKTNGLNSVNKSWLNHTNKTESKEQLSNNNLVNNIFVDVTAPKLKAIILNLVEQNFFKENTYFYPNKGLTRAEMTKIVVQISHQEDYANKLWQEAKNKNYYYAVFKDVDINAWFAPYLFVAKEMKIVNGYDDGFFHGEQYLTRAEAIKMLLTAINAQISKQKKLIYKDVNHDDWFKAYVDYAYQNKLIEINDNYFYPAKIATRADIAQWLEKIVL